MKKLVILLIFGLLPMFTVQAQFAKPLKKRSANCWNTSPFSIGITGSFAANDMFYTAVNKSALAPYLAPTGGLAMEWSTMNWVSVGLDVSYAMRGTHEAFATEFLTNYSSTDIARVDYVLDLNGIEVRGPITYYIGYGENLRPYVFVAPRVGIWLNGKAKWERFYDKDTFPPLAYETELTQSMIKPYDLSVVGGVGLCCRTMVGHSRLFLKFDLSYGMSVLSNFSKSEVEETAVFLGWGDIAHETLGLRYLRNVEARLTVLLPFRKIGRASCRERVYSGV